MSHNLRLNPPLGAGWACVSRAVKVRATGLTLRVIAVALVLAYVARSATSAPPGSLSATVSYEDVTLKGVHLGAPEGLVRTNLGPPREETAGAGELACEMGFGEGFEKTWRYDGLVVHLCRTTDDPNYHVFHWVTTGRKWATADGIGVGSSILQVVRRLGPHEPTSKSDDGSIVVNYGLRDADGFLWFRLRNGIVVEMGMAEDWS